MKQLLYKELRLCLPWITLLYLVFSLMLLIPNYPYLIAYFFLCNGIMQIFAFGQQNNDLLFTAMLPVAKRKVVTARILSIVLLQGAMLLLTAAMLPLGNLLYASAPDPSLWHNEAGVDRSLTLLGEGLMLMGLYNRVALPGFYRSDVKFGRVILISMIVKFAFITVAEGFMDVARAMRDTVPLFAWVDTNLDCFPATGEAWLAQGVVLLVGAAIYALLTWRAHQRCAAIFEQVSL